MYQGRLIEAGVLAQAQLEEAWARGDLTVMTFLTMIACITLLAAGRVQQAERACERACAAWQSDEVTVQDFMLLGARTLPTLYRGASLESWRGVQPALDRFRGSLFGRVPFRGVIDAASCGWAAAAARQTTDEAERRALLREAVRSAKRARPGKSGGGVTGCPRAVLPCVLGQRETAITALREWLEVPGLAPLGIQLARRRLGVLLGDDEGHTLVADADAFLSSAGVVDPEHFVAMLMPGVEIEEANR
jgi:hypothetical protein